MDNGQRLFPPVSPIDDDFPLYEAREVWNAIHDNYQEMVNAKTTFEYKGQHAIYLTIYSLSVKWMNKDRFKEVDLTQKDPLDHIAEKGFHQLIALKILEPIPLDVVRKNGGKIDKPRWPGKDPESKYYVITSSLYPKDHLLKLADLLSELPWALDMERVTQLAEASHDLSKFAAFVWFDFRYHTKGKYGPNRDRFSPDSLNQKMDEAEELEDRISEIDEEDGNEESSNDNA